MIDKEDIDVFIEQLNELKEKSVDNVQIDYSEIEDGKLISYITKRYEEGIFLAKLSKELPEDGSN